MKWGFLLLTLLCALKAGAQFEQAIDAGSIGSGSSWTGSRPQWSLLQNPALLNDLGTYSIGFAGGRHFGIRSLESTALSAAIRLAENAAFGLGIEHRYAGTAVSFSSISLAFQREFANRFSIGIGVNGQLLRFPEYYREKRVHLRIGFIHDLSEASRIGAVLLTQVYSSQKFDRYEDINLSVGFITAISHSSTIRLSVHLEKNVFKLSSGLVWPLNEQWEIASGLRLPSLESSFVLTRFIKSFRLNLALSYHLHLGESIFSGFDYEMD